MTIVVSILKATDHRGSSARPFGQLLLGYYPPDGHPGVLDDRLTTANAPIFHTIQMRSRLVSILVFSLACPLTHNGTGDKTLNATFSHAWKRQRGTSGDWKASAANSYWSSLWSDIAVCPSLCRLQGLPLTHVQKSEPNDLFALIPADDIIIGEFTVGSPTRFLKFTDNTSVLA
jgi:hypothetical protein